MQRSTQGMTMIELLIVISIIGILGTIGYLSGSNIARRQAAQGAIATFQQSVWQGATMAASRGSTVELLMRDQELVLVNGSSNATLRRYRLPAGVELPVSNPILRFLPPGKIDQESLNKVSDGFVIGTTEGRYRVEISVIGEVQTERLGDN